MFEWDPDKSEATRRRRGFGFEVIEQCDWDYAACLEEQEINSETREKWIGPIDDRLYVAVLTQRGDRMRVISMRRAAQVEINIWRKEFQDG
jgi:uncharacterized DUF497 family protein